MVKFDFRQKILYQAEVCNALFVLNESGDVGKVYLQRGGEPLDTRCPPVVVLFLRKTF